MKIMLKLLGLFTFDLEGFMQNILHDIVSCVGVVFAPRSAVVRAQNDNLALFSSQGRVVRHFQDHWPGRTRGFYSILIDKMKLKIN